MKRVSLLLALLLVFVLATVVLAQTGGGYDLSWSAFTNGGGKSTGGGYTVEGVIGQPAVAGQPQRGAKFDARSGVFGPPLQPPATGSKAYLPLIMK
jgi:hypothetical protein